MGFQILELSYTALMIIHLMHSKKIEDKIENMFQRMKSMKNNQTENSGSIKLQF